MLNVFNGRSYVILAGVPKKTERGSSCQHGMAVDEFGRGKAQQPRLVLPDVDIPVADSEEYCCFSPSLLRQRHLDKREALPKPHRAETEPAIRQGSVAKEMP